METPASKQKQASKLILLINSINKKEKRGEESPIFGSQLRKAGI
jgi:hypothetical protein